MKQEHTRKQGLVIGVGALLAAALAALGWWASLDSERGREGLRAGHEPAAAGTAELDPAPLLRERGEAGRTAVVPDSSVERAQPTASADVPLATRARGRVYDMAGAPVGYLPLGLAEPILVSGLHSTRRGYFEVEIVDRRMELVSGDKRFATIRSPVLAPGGPETGHVLLVQRAVHLGGMVVDRNGRRIRGAVLAVEIPLELYERIPAAIDGTVERAFEAVTTGNGRFDLSGVPAIPGALLVTRARGHATDQRALPLASNDDLRIELALAGAGPTAVPTVRGVVLHESGVPVVEAEVRLGGQEALTDGRGHFAILIGEIDSDTALVAAKRGYQAAVFEGFGTIAHELVASLDGVELRLGGRTESITGKLVYPGGGPCMQWNVELLDGRQIGGVASALVAEDLARDGENAERIGSRGTFRMEGLFPGRSYRIHAWNAATLEHCTSPPILAGTQNYLMCVDEPRFRKVSGTAHARDGTPLDGVDVRLTMLAREPGQRRSAGLGQRVRTNAYGWFVFHSVPRNDVVLHFGGPKVVDTKRELSGSDLGADLVVELARKCKLTIWVTPGDEAPDAFEVTDAKGDVLPVELADLPLPTSSTRPRLTPSRPARCRVSEDARGIVLYRRERRLAELAIDVHPGHETVIHR